MQKRPLTPVQGSFTASTAASMTLQAISTELYLCLKTSDGYFRFGTAATAGSAVYLPADTPIILLMDTETTSLSVIGTASGTAYVQEFV